MRRVLSDRSTIPDGAKEFESDETSTIRASRTGVGIPESHCEPKLTGVGRPGCRARRERRAKAEVGSAPRKVNG